MNEVKNASRNKACSFDCEVERNEYANEIKLRRIKEKREKNEKNKETKPRRVMV